MAEENECKGLRTLDTVQGLIDYVLDVKPFHSKIVEVLVEYVYEELMDTDVLEKLLTQIEVIKPDTLPLFTGCGRGYSLYPYGGLRGWPVISPNQRIAFEDYPAINSTTNVITVPGDKTDELEPGDQFQLISYLDDTEPLCRIVDIDKTGLNHAFIIEENTIHSIPFITATASYTGPLQTSGMPLDDERDFTVVSVALDTPSVGLIRVEVSQFIKNPVPIGHFGLIRTPADHSGIFTVESITHSGGSNTIWSDINDPSTYLIGDDPHTLIKTEENLDPLPFIGPRQSYSVIMRLLPIEINKVLSYSNFAGIPTNSPDEGYLNLNIVSAVQSTLDLIGVAVPDTGKITVSGNLSESNIFVGERVRILNSTDNNGLYVITSMTYDGGNDETTLGVQERIRSDIPDGTARIDIPSNMFFMDGDHSHRFRQGVEFNVVGGSFQGRYMTLYSDFVGNQTRIRPVQEILDPGHGLDIVDIPSSTMFTINRDKTHEFLSGSTVNIVGSTLNDGVYEVVSSMYDSLQDLTIVEVVQELEPTIDGQAFVVDMGFIKELIYGFADSSDLCDYNPETLIQVKFLEQFRIDGITLQLNNNLIAYNMENDDWWGYELPIYTNYSATPPVVAEQVTAPVTPDLNDFWFNDDTGILYYWSVNDTWIETKTIYWLDTTTNLFHYRTMYDRQLYDYGAHAIGPKVRVDTDWVQMFANPPGFNDHQPAVPPSFNAHVATWEDGPHRKTHTNVYTTPAHFDNSYTLPGGNYVQRMGPETRLEVYDLNTTTGEPLLNFSYPQSFEIQSVNLGGNTFTIDGVYDWFYESGVVLGVRIWNGTYHEMLITGSSTGAGQTTIQVSSADINKFQGLTSDFGLLLGAVFDPRNNWAFPNDQRKTYVLPVSGTDLYANGIIYNYVEPQRIHALTTDATIKENFQIDWGSAYAWQIKRTDSGSAEIAVVNDITNFLDTTNKLFITQSQGNDGEYEIVNHFLNVGGAGPLQSETVIILNPAPPVDTLEGQHGFVQIEDSDVVDWFQYMLVSADATANEFIVSGDATNDVPNGGSFRVVGTTNDGTYTAISSPTYNGGLDQTTISVTNVPNNDTGGWVEHV